MEILGLVGKWNLEITGSFKLYVNILKVYIGTVVWNMYSFVEREKLSMFVYIWAPSVKQ